MFLGEFSCLGVFYLLVWRDRWRPEPSMAPSQPFSPLLFLPPALCDMTGTSIMYVGKCWRRGCCLCPPLPLWGSGSTWGWTRLSGCSNPWCIQFLGGMTLKLVRGI